MSRIDENDDDVTFEIEITNFGFVLVFSLPGAGLVGCAAAGTEGKGRLGLEPSPFGERVYDPGTKTLRYRVRSQSTKSLSCCWWWWWWWGERERRGAKGAEPRPTRDEGQPVE